MKKSCASIQLVILCLAIFSVQDVRAQETTLGYDDNERIREIFVLNNLQDNTRLKLVLSGANEKETAHMDRRGEHVIRLRMKREGDVTIIAQTCAADANISSSPPEPPLPPAWAMRHETFGWLAFNREMLLNFRWNEFEDRVQRIKDAAREIMRHDSYRLNVETRELDEWLRRIGEYLRTRSSITSSDCSHPVSAAITIHIGKDKYKGFSGAVIIEGDRNNPRIRLAQREELRP